MDSANDWVRLCGHLHKHFGLSNIVGNLEDHCQTDGWEFAERKAVELAWKLALAGLFLSSFCECGIGEALKSKLVALIRFSRFLD